MAERTRGKTSRARNRAAVVEDLEIPQEEKRRRLAPRARAEPRRAHSVRHDAHSRLRGDPRELRRLGGADHPAFVEARRDLGFVVADARALDLVELAIEAVPERDRALDPRGDHVGEVEDRASAPDADVRQRVRSHAEEMRHDDVRPDAVHRVLDALPHSA
jgi:hypothetical protein